MGNGFRRSIEEKKQQVLRANVSRCEGWLSGQAGKRDRLAGQHGDREV